MGKLTRSGGKKLLALTVIAIISYAMGSLAHSEILHFFAEIFNIY